MDKYIFTVLYPIDMHIDIRILTGKIPYGPIFYFDDEYNPENWSKFVNYPKPTQNSPTLNSDLLALGNTQHVNLSY